MNECPCKQCICFAICVSKEVILCDLLIKWYRTEYPSHRSSNRKMLEEIYGRMNLPTIYTEDKRTGVVFKGKKLYGK